MSLTATVTAIERRNKEGGKGTMSSSRKTDVIRILFEKIWPKGAKAPKKIPMIVSSADVGKAIRKANSVKKGEKPLSDKNAANFLKDIIRVYSCNSNWPSELKKRRITARQRYGKGQVFEFVPYKKGDKIPFPDRYEPTSRTPTIELESLSIPRHARALGRKDEAWLTQVLVTQRVAHTHFSLVSRLPCIELTHLQMSVKTKPEIDAIYIATLDYEGRELRALVTCEAKQDGERLLEDQIREQIGAAFKMTDHLREEDQVEAVIPVAVKVATRKGLRGIYMVEFDMILRSKYDNLLQVSSLHDIPLKLGSRAFYVFKPKIHGIS